MTRLLLLLTALSAEPPYGSVVEAVFELNGVSVTMSARLVPCSKGKRCVQLSNGRRMGGHFEGERFIVEESP